jgi:hypothetical protein
LRDRVGADVEERLLGLQLADPGVAEADVAAASRSWFSERPVFTWIAKERGTTSR